MSSSSCSPIASPLLKWTGGKSAELPVIRQAMPRDFARYIDPFVGGGALLFDVGPEHHACVNDRSRNLIGLYRLQKDPTRVFRAALDALNVSWKALDEVPLAEPSEDVEHAAVEAVRPFLEFLPGGIGGYASADMTACLNRKRSFMARKEAANDPVTDPEVILRTAIKGGFYTTVRRAFNTLPAGPLSSVTFWFLREFAYGGMFRVNSGGAFNIPYGGNTYNKKSFDGRLRQLDNPETIARLSNTSFHNDDFDVFLRAVSPEACDFVFLDPPYDSPFSTYDGTGFNRDDHKRLAATMASCRARWMMVISETDFVRETYVSLPGARTFEFGKTYQGHIKARNNRKATHLLITNYDWQGLSTEVDALGLAA